MSSEFPMSFPEESQLASSRPKKKPDGKSSVHHSESHSSQTKSPARKNVIPLSRPADSMLAPMSGMADASCGGHSAFNDYPMSEFSTEQSHSNRRRPARLLLRAFLGLTFLGLWVAIATGSLHTDLPFVSQLRMQLGMSDQSTRLSEAPDDNEVLPSAAPVPVTSQATVEVSNSSMDISEPTSSASGAAIPSMAAAEDVERAAKLLVEQGSQFNALEQHLATMVVQHSSAESLDSILDSMERRHRDALNALQTLRNQGKNAKP